MRRNKEKVQSKVMNSQHDYKTSEKKYNRGMLFDEALKFKKVYSESSISIADDQIPENSTESSSSSSEYDEYTRHDLDAINFYQEAATSLSNNSTDSDSYYSYKDAVLSNYPYTVSEELIALLNQQEGNNSSEENQREGNDSTEENQLSNSDNVETSYSGSVDSYEVEYWPPVEIIPTYSGNVDPVDKSEREESHIKDLHNKSKLKNREKHLAKLQMQEANRAESENQPELVQKSQKAGKSQGFFDRRQIKHQEQYHEVRNNYTK